MCSITDLHVGRVFELYPDDQAIPPKPKMSVIVGLSADQSEFGSVFINTGVNPFKMDNPELSVLQYPVSPCAQYPFLRHDSFVDCSQIFQRLPSTVSRQILNGNGKLLGVIPPEEVAKIIELIRNADPISPYYLNLYQIA